MPHFDALRLAAFEAAPGATLAVECQAARFPARWLRIIEHQYRANTRRRADSRWLPTRALIDLLDALDPNVLHVSSRLGDEAWIYSRAPIDREVVATAVEAWAATEITDDRPDLDWFDFLGDDPVHWYATTLDLLDCGVHPNGTARPAVQVFDLLPGYLANMIVSQGLTLRDTPRSFILSPADSSGRRSAVCWPPERVDDEDGPGLWAPKIDFHLQTVPLHGRPRIHAELSMTRFPLQAVAYVPRRGHGPPAVTLWLHARDGFLRGSEQPTMLSASASRRVISGNPRWTWGPGLVRALARLTDHRYPDPDDVLLAPGRYTDTPISAHVVYSGGTTLANLDQDDESNGDDEPRKAKSVRHPARTGFQPIDHLDLHDRLLPLLEPLGIVGVPELTRSRAGLPAVMRPRDVPGQRYTLELWTQSPSTRQAILDTLTHNLGFTPAPGGHAAEGEPGLLEFTGPFTLTVVLQEVGSFAAGIPRPPKDKMAKSKDGLEQRVQEIVVAVPRCEDRRAAIVELDGPRYFSRLKMDDPKPALKKGFVLAGRRVQCLRPVNEYRPKPDAKKPKRVLPGTGYAMADANRATSAIQDALRQLGRVGAFTPPPGLAGPCELLGFWLERVETAVVPIVIRIYPAGIATAQIAIGERAEEMPYADLPMALVEGRGRLRRNGNLDAKIRTAQFLLGALGVGDVTHDRVVFVRSTSFRNSGWDWLQDRHITPDLLVLPGKDSQEATVGRLGPSACPGLRIVRVRGRDGIGEVPRGFGVTDDDFGRISGLFRHSDRVFYGLNPRSAQTQTPKGLSKLDPAQTRNATVQGSNPNPLEIVPIFLQEGDDPEDWAMYTQALRRAYLHTEIASQFPLPLHLGSLAGEYLL